MLSRISTRASSFSLHLLQQDLTHSHVNGPYTLQQVLFWRRLSREQASTSNIPISFPKHKSNSTEHHHRYGFLKYFVRSLTAGRIVHRCNDVDLQVLLPQHLDVKDTDVVVKVCESEKRKAGLGKDSETLNVEPKNIEEEISVNPKRAGHRPWKLVSCSACSTNPGVAECPTQHAKTELTMSHAGLHEESVAETSKQVKVIITERKVFAEVHTVQICRKLTRQFLSQLQEKIDFLDSAAVPVVQVRLLLKRRAFLSTSPEKLVQVIKALTEIFDSKSIALQVLTANAGILCLPLEMSQHKMHLLSLFEVDRQTCIKLATTPFLWTLSAERCEEKLNFLKELGMNAEARCKVIFRCPSVLTNSVCYMGTVVAFFEGMGICGPNLCKFLESNPRVLRLSVPKSLAVKMKLLKDWGFSVNEVIVAFREVAGFSAEHMKAQFKCLRDQGFTHDEAAFILRRKPNIFGVGSTVLKAKLVFLHQINRDKSEVLRFPGYLTHSLENRMIPRFKALKAVSLINKPALSTILSGKTSVFKKRFKIPASVECL